jgi:hypothetical protein
MKVVGGALLIVYLAYWAGIAQTYVLKERSRPNLVG